MSIRILLFALLAMVVSTAFVSSASDKLKYEAVTIVDPSGVMQVVDAVTVERLDLLREHEIGELINSGFTVSGCVCSSWQPSPTQEHPDRLMRVCGAFPGPGGCIQERYCGYCTVWPDCGDCSL